MQQYSQTGASSPWLEPKHFLSFADRSSLSPLPIFERPHDVTHEQATKNHQFNIGGPLYDPNYRRRRYRNEISQNGPDRGVPRRLKGPTPDEVEDLSY
jgi:hypothetical protein